MKFAVALAVASTASTAMAGMVVPRDATIVTGVISTAGSDIDAVKAAADAYKGDKTDLVSAADKLVSDLKDGKTKVSGGPDLSVVDAANLASPVQDLAKKGSALTDSLTARKSEVEKAGECKTVQDQIAAISTASNDLIAAVIAKVPEAAKAIAQSIADPLTQVLQKAEDSYKDCKDGTSGGSSSTGGSTATSTASSGSATGTVTGTATGTSTAAPTGSATGTKTGGASTTSCPSSSGAASSTGGVKPTNTPPPVAGAAMYAPAGILAAIAAVLAL